MNELEWKLQQLELRVIEGKQSIHARKSVIKSNYQRFKTNLVITEILIASFVIGYILASTTNKSIHLPHMTEWISKIKEVPFLLSSFKLFGI